MIYSIVSTKLPPALPREIIPLVVPEAELPPKEAADRSPKSVTSPSVATVIYSMTLVAPGA